MSDDYVTAMAMAFFAMAKTKTRSIETQYGTIDVPFITEKKIR
jgi:hypothetical protein